jgi:hypothetical protein
VAAAALALAAAACGSAAPSGLTNGLDSFGLLPAATPLVPGGDACSVLGAGDFAQFGLTFTSTDHILNNVATCEFVLTDATNGNTARPVLEFTTPDDFDFTQQSESRSSEDEFQTISGIGDSAYAFYSFGDIQLFVKAKGYTFYVGTGGLGNGVGSGDELPDAQAIAQEVVAKL